MEEFEFDARLVGHELPVDADLAEITVIVPDGRFAVDRVDGRNSATESLPRQDAQLRFREVRPTAVLEV